MPSRIMGMDQKNSEIVRLLRRDGRIAYSEVGARVGLSENAVSNRIKRLREARFIGEIILDIPVQAWLLLKLKDSDNVDQQKIVESTFKSFFLNTTLIKEAYRLAGWFDYLAVLTADDRGKMFDLIRTIAATDCISEHQLQQNLGLIDDEVDCTD